MCSKCNGCLGDTPKGAQVLLGEAERRKKAREKKNEKNPADEFMEGYIR